jgi:serine/threonine protein kinase
LSLQTEVEILGSINHPHIVRLFKVYDSAKYFFMVMELCCGGELFDRIVEKSKYSENEAASVIKSLASALDYCHSRGIVHRDLKPENLLLRSKNDETIKIADFGLAKITNSASQSLMTTACGTPGYVSPEVLLGRGYSAAVDLWSVGVILYILLCGFPPFYSENNAVLFEQIKRGEFDFPSPYFDSVSDDAISLVRSLLTVDPAHRMSAKQLLAHPWVQGNASSSPLENFSQEQLKKLIARRRLKNAIKGVMASNAFAKLGRLSKLKSSPTLSASPVPQYSPKQSLTPKVPISSVAPTPSVAQNRVQSHVISDPPVTSSAIRNSVNLQQPAGNRLSGAYYGVPQTNGYVLQSNR